MTSSHLRTGTAGSGSSSTAGSGSLLNTGSGSLFRFFAIAFLLLFVLSGATFAQDADKEPSRKKDSPKKGQTQELGAISPLLSHDPVEPQPDPMQPGMMSQKPIAGPVLLTATYYFGDADKDTVPVLVLHGQGGNRNDFAPLTKALTDAGFAVLAPDLRGHGKSGKRYEVTPPQYKIQTTTKSRSGGKGSSKPKTVTEMVPTAPATRRLVDFKDKEEEVMPKDFFDMARYDLPALRDELFKAHDAGMINMNRLVIIGIDRGAALAAFQTMQDWRDKDSPRLTKTLIMIAPTDLDVTVDTSRLFLDNKWMGAGLAALFVVPQGNPTGQMLCEKIRTELIGKKVGDESVEERFQIMNYVPEKKVKTEKGETVAPMTWAETFANKEVNLTQKIIDFINKRNALFKEKEARWSRIR